jgi:hypothetical protein
MTAPAPKTDTFKHPKGSFERLTASNYPSWQNNMQRLLRSIHCWNITAGLEEQPEELKGPVSADIKYQNRKDIEKFNTRLEDGAAAIYNACSVSICIHINKMFHPKAMWDELAERVNIASTEVGRQALNRSFTSIRPTPGAPIDDFFTRLIEIQDQLQGTAEEINDASFKSHALGVLPKNFNVTAQIQRGTPGTTIQSIRAALIEEERNQAQMVEPAATTEAHYTAGSNKRPRSKKWCSFCRSSTHNLEECFKRKRNQGDRNQGDRNRNNQDNDSDQEECWHCGKQGHRWENCLVRKAGKESRERAKKKRARKENKEEDNDDKTIEDVKAGL